MVDCSSLSSTLYRMNPTNPVKRLFACISSSLSLAFERPKLDVFHGIPRCFLDVYSEYSAVWKNDSQMKSQHQDTSRSGPGSRFCGSFLHGLLFKVLCEKASEMNMHSNIFKLKNMEWHLSSQLSLETVLTTLKFNIIQRRNIKVCMKVVSLNVTKPSIFNPLPEAKLAATPAEWALQKNACWSGDDLVFRTMKVNWSYSMCMYVHLFQYMQNIKMYESKTLQKILTMLN